MVGLLVAHLIYAPVFAAECEANIGAERPRIYVATFLVADGKAGLGEKISDNIAIKFINDGRFDVIPRETVVQQMSALSRSKMQTQAYLELSSRLAVENSADCVVFGKITRRGDEVTFLVRMAAVTSGENRRKVDETVPRAEASEYFDKLGDSLVSYFETAPGVVAAESEPRQHEPRKSGATLSLWGGYNWIYVDSKTRDTLDLVDRTTGGKSTIGGIGGGADLWLPLQPNVQLGGGIAYLPLYSYKYSSSSGGSTTTFDYDVNFVPAVFQIRLLSTSGLYAGAGVAYFMSFASAKVSIDGLSANVSAAGSTLGLVGIAGWQIGQNSSVGLDLGSKVWYVPEDGAGWAATPYAGIFIKF